MPRAGVQTSGHYHQLELRPSSIRPLRPRRHVTARCCCRCRKRKKKEPKKKESGLMETDATVEKQKTVFPPLLAKPFRVLHRFHRPGDGEYKTTKPDTSFATETGHFHLLPT